MGKRSLPSWVVVPMEASSLAIVPKEEESSLVVGPLEEPCHWHTIAVDRKVVVDSNQHLAACPCSLAGHSSIGSCSQHQAVRASRRLALCGQRMNGCGCH